MTHDQPTFSYQLRHAISRSPASCYRISKQTGISEGQLSRFMHGKVGLSLAAIDRLVEYLELRLAERDTSADSKEG